MEGYKRVEKPKSEYISHHRIALTISEQKKLVDYLNTVALLIVLSGVFM